MTAMEGATGIAQLLVARVLWIAVHSVAISRILSVADHVDTSDQLARKIRMFRQNSRVDDGDRDIWATRCYIPRIGQPDLRVMPLLDIHRIVWRCQWLSPIVGFCSRYVRSTCQRFNSPKCLLLRPLALGHTCVLPSTKSFVDPIYRGNSCLDPIEVHQ